MKSCTVKRKASLLTRLRPKIDENYSYICNNDELCDWLMKAKPFMKQKLKAEGNFEFVACYNQQPPERLEKVDRRKKQIEITSFFCEECGKYFSRIDSLKRHKKQYCKIANLFAAKS